MALKPTSNAIPRCPPSPGAGDEEGEGSLLPAANLDPSVATGQPQEDGTASDGGEEAGTHVYKVDPRNNDILVLIRDGVDGSSNLVRPMCRRGCTPNSILQL